MYSVYLCSESAVWDEENKTWAMTPESAIPVAYAKKTPT
jgi:hypothetical protein